MNEKPLIRVIDDDESVCEALSYMLEMEGWEVSSFHNATDFLHGDFPSRHGVAILDVRMPGMTGLQLQEELLNRQYPHPLVFLSGHGDIAMAVSTVKKGAVNFLQKPVNPIELIAVLRECLKTDLSREALTKEETAEVVARLTPRERQIVNSLLAGLTNTEMADRFGVSVRTIEHHRESVYRKMDVNTMDQLKKRLVHYQNITNQ